MRLVALTQRLGEAEHGELREGLDVRWHTFLDACDLVPLPLPNVPATALALLRATRPAGIVLTGGADLAAYGGAYAQRDATEAACLEHARETATPVHGVCRGMQAMVVHTGGRLEPLEGHVATRHVLDGTAREVNSYHRWAVADPGPAWAVTATSGGAVEAVQHRSERWSGTCWHPEREPVPDPDDVAAFVAAFGGP